MISNPIVAPVKGASISASWGAAVAERANECADAIDAMRGPGGLVSLREPQATAEGLTPWAVRYHVTEADDEGKWEIWLPPGCMAVGGTLTPINLAASEVPGHGDDEAGWYLLCLDEDEGASETYTFGGGDGAVTTVSRSWDIIAHAKTSAKMYGVDDLNASARRLLYVSARKRRVKGDPNQTDAQRVANTWGDEFSQMVARVTVGTRTQGQGEAQPFRDIARVASSPISVQGRVRSSFDLLWYFSVSSTDGRLKVEKVYCTRNLTTIGGMSVVGPTLAEVTDAEDSIWVMIRTNPLADNISQNAVSVVVDPLNNQNDDKFLTWLKIYSMRYNAVTGDYRSYALVNAITYR